MTLESVYGRDEMFARRATSVVELKYGAGRSAVQPIGAEAMGFMTCRIGARVLPMDICDERYIEPDLLERFLRE